MPFPVYTVSSISAKTSRGLCGAGSGILSRSSLLFTGCWGHEWKIITISKKSIKHINICTFIFKKSFRLWKKTPYAICPFIIYLSIRHFISCPFLTTGWYGWGLEIIEKRSNWITRGSKDEIFCKWVYKCLRKFYPAEIAVETSLALIKNEVTFFQAVVKWYQTFISHDENRMNNR